uniref:Uncharacterized protein n=1 Tax=Nelumbo nucifera TaxID=4432 RepID=A0A822ZLR8_NELNU|nr:TPA_asm: hypothetical protein HUJ06_002156 [Nelumbo nucifera]
MMKHRKNMVMDKEKRKEICERFAGGRMGNVVAEIKFIANCSGGDKTEMDLTGKKETKGSERNGIEKERRKHVR